MRRDEPEDLAFAALYAPDGMEQWQRAMHARCGTHPTLGEITCPWCDALTEVAPSDCEPHPKGQR